MNNEKIYMILSIVIFVISTVIISTINKIIPYDYSYVVRVYHTDSTFNSVYLGKNTEEAKLNAIKFNHSPSKIICYDDNEGQRIGLIFVIGPILIFSFMCIIILLTLKYEF